MGECPVCGKLWPREGDGEYEEERYAGAEGAEMVIVIPYCNIGSECNAVEAANTMDRLAEPFLELTGAP